MDKTTVRVYEQVTASQSLSSQLVAQSKRKEKARIAARARRSQEASIIMDMANELHITQEKIRRIDKATIVKLAIDYIKAFEILCRLRSCNSNNIDPLDSSTNDNNNISNGSNSNSSISINISNSCSEICCHEAHSRSSSSSGSTRSNNSINISSQTNGSISNNIINSNYISDRSSTGSSNEPASICITPISSIGSPIPSEPMNSQMQRDTQFRFQHQHHNHNHQRQQQQQQQQNPPQQSDFPAPKLNTRSIFAPKTNDMDQHFLMINERDGRSSFVLKPDTEILDDDDLTHLAPQAGDTSISLEVEPLDGIVLDTSLFSGSPQLANKKAPMLIGKDLIDTCCIRTVD